MAAPLYVKFVAIQNLNSKIVPAFQYKKVIDEKYMTLNSKKWDFSGRWEKLLIFVVFIWTKTHYYEHLVDI